MVNAKIKDLAPGTVFNAGPIDVRILEHFTNGRTLLIADTCIADRHFADQSFKTRPEKPETNPNDWRFSNLRKELNTEFLAAFDQAEGPIRSAHILTADWDLEDHEGGAGYGVIQDKIALLSEAMFRKYSEQDLLALDDWWWLITPYPARAVRALSTLTAVCTATTRTVATVAFGRLSMWNLGSLYPWNLTRSNFLILHCWPNSLQNSLSKKSFAESPKARKTVTKMKVKYGDLKAGDVFEDNNWPYVKTTEANQAVELSTGALVHFFNGSLVDESDLVLVHQAVLPAEMPDHLKGGLKHGKD